MSVAVASSSTAPTIVEKELEAVEEGRSASTTVENDQVIEINTLEKYRRENDVFPDGGLRAWLVVTGVCCRFF
jgi:hypothetical protein